MPWIAERRLLWGDGYIEAGQPVPDNEPSRNYRRMASIGSIRFVPEGAMPATVDPTPVSPPTSRAGDTSIPIPDGWNTLPWTPRKAGDPSLRALAGLFTDGSVANKAAAVTIIEAELARRAAGANKDDGRDQLVAIPENWRELPEAERMSLAAQFAGDMQIAGIEDADAVIELELESRNG